jgi:hypothetical protein
VTDQHLAYLYYIALNYLTDFAYDRKVPTARLQRDLDRYRPKLVELCSTRYASTNVVERYAALQAVLGVLDRPRLTVVDVGTSIGLGLMSLNTDSFGHARIDPILRPYIDKHVDVTAAIGIDPQRPDMHWQAACYLPENKRNRRELKATYAKLKKEGTPVHLVQGNITDIEGTDLQQGTADVVWTSNVLYQVKGMASGVVRGIRWLLKDDGFWINADYRHQNKPFATRQNPWVTMTRNKRYWNKVYEVTEAPSDVVKALKRGRDFARFKSACAAAPASG